MSKFEVTQETASNDAAAKVLGQRVAAPITYTPEILVRIPRSENRDEYGIVDSLFVGQDDWYCYECSTITSNSVPVYFDMIITIPSNSKYIVESKSLKLYLNSFNMERSTSPDPRHVIIEYVATVKKDLEALLETEIEVGSDYYASSLLNLREQCGFESLERLVDYSKIRVNNFNENPKLLKTSPLRQHKKLRVFFDGFRSNCKVTHQPDYATVFIDIETTCGVDPASIVEYLSSFRNENHFHEECVELIYKRLNDAYNPKILFVRANYTRRGGIDINPTRVSEIKRDGSVSVMAGSVIDTRSRAYQPSRTKFQ